MTEPQTPQKAKGAQEPIDVLSPLPEDPPGPDDMENIRVGYQAAVSIWAYLGDLVWSKYNAMLVANSLVMAAAAIGLDSQSHMPLLTIGLPIVGLSLCALWVLLIAHGLASFVPYIAAAREAEENYFRGYVSAIERGTKFIRTGRAEYKIKIDDSNEVKSEKPTLAGKLSRSLRSTLYKSGSEISEQQEACRLKMKWWERVKTPWSAYAVIVVFAVVYVIMLMQVLL